MPCVKTIEAEASGRLDGFSNHGYLRPDFCISSRMVDQGIHRQSIIDTLNFQLQ